MTHPWKTEIKPPTHAINAGTMQYAPMYIVQLTQTKQIAGVNKQSIILQKLQCSIDKGPKVQDQQCVKKLFISMT